jgi:hypothetical protein
MFVLKRRLLASRFELKTPPEAKNSPPMKPPPSNPIVDPKNKTNTTAIVLK